jgi:hypothetical protein
MKIRKLMEIPKGYYKRLALAESSGNPNAVAMKKDENGNLVPASSASGMFQFTEGTWRDTVKEMGKNYSLEDRFDVKKSTEVNKYFTEKNEKYLIDKLGRDPNEAELYAAHHFGNYGASKLLSQVENSPNTRISDIFSADVIDANPHIKGKNALEVYNILAQKMGVEGIQKENITESYKEDYPERKIDNTFVDIPANYATLPEIKVEEEKPLTEQDLRKILEEEKGKNVKTQEDSFVNAFKQQTQPQQDLSNYQPQQQDLSHLYNYIQQGDDSFYTQGPADGGSLNGD